MSNSVVRSDWILYIESQQCYCQSEVIDAQIESPTFFCKPIKCWLSFETLDIIGGQNLKYLNVRESINKNNSSALCGWIGGSKSKTYFVQWRWKLVFITPSIMRYMHWNVTKFVKTISWNPVGDLFLETIQHLIFVW